MPGQSEDVRYWEQIGSGWLTIKPTRLDPERTSETKKPRTMPGLKLLEIEDQYLATTGPPKW